MSNKINHNEHDALGGLFRQQLESHSLSVDGDGWSKIEQQLGKKKNSKVILFWSVCASTAAAIALLLIINGLFTENLPISEISQQTVINNITEYEEESITSGNKQEQNTNKNGIIDSEPTYIAVIQEQSKQIEKEADKHSIAKTPTEEVIQSSISSDDISTDMPATTESTTALIAENKTQIDALSNKNESITKTDNDLTKSNIFFIADNPDKVPLRKETGKWLLAAAFGTGNGNNNLNDDTNPMYNAMADNGYISGEYNRIHPFDGMTIEDFSDISYQVPLSFGITARKNLSKHWGVESGLVYTFLSTSFKWSNYDVRQHLHYIGIPVNVVAYLWNNNPNWKIYISGGAMVEKGLRNIYTQKEYSSNTTRTTIVKTSIDGFQWSINGALGVNYRITKSFGLYFEPRLSYYFDNNQPISMRTEWPVSVGINVGLNYEF